MTETRQTAISSFITDDTISAIAITSSKCHLGCTDSFNEITWLHRGSLVFIVLWGGYWSLSGTDGESSDTALPSDS